MNFREYTEESKKTLGYSTSEKLISCCMLELVGECVEYLEKAYGEEYHKEDELKKELGDFCYSLAMLPAHYHVDVSKTEAPFSITEIRRRPPNLLDDGLYCLGKLSEIVKKTIRDDDWRLTRARYEMFKHYLDSLYTYVLQECTDRDWNLSDVLYMNVEKLQDRLARNKINGDGDNR